jgi:hypothetical protein
MTSCKSCGAAIRFVKSERGFTMCLNAEPDAQRGNVLVEAGMARVLNRQQALIRRGLGTELLLSHHATCPDAAAFTRRRVKA